MPDSIAHKRKTTVRPKKAKPIKILIVEDNRDGADSLSLLLSMGGHEVKVAYDGPTGVQVAVDFQPEVVFLDIALPGLSGYEVAGKISAKTKYPPFIIAVTGFGREQDRQRALDAGCHVHLVKPVQPEIISTLLANLHRI